MNESPKGSYLFGRFELDPAAHALRRDGERVHLQPKAFETLLLLVSQAGQVVDKEALLEHVWRGQVVSDNALTRAIREVRRALGDSASEPRFIETLPRVGYRFRAAVERVDDSPESPAGAAGAPAGHRGGWRRWAAVGALVAIVAVSAWWLGAQRVQAPGAPVVVAFGELANATGEVEAAYLADGLLEGVARRLAAADGISVLRLPPGGADAQAAKRLGADWRLHGMMQHLLGETVVVAELSRLEGEAAWRREFALKNGDVVAVQQALAEGVAQTLEVELPPEPAYLALAADADRIRAHRLYLIGRGHLARRAPAEVVRAVELFEQALELMPNHAGAMASLGVAYVLGPDDRFPPQTARQRAATLFERALDSDPSTALAWAGRGLLALDGSADGADARELFEKALALDPNDPDALVWYATVLGSEGRIREAAEAQRRALALEPRHPSVTGNLAFNLARLGDYDEALALLEPVSEDGLTEPMLYYQRFSLLGQRGRLAELFELALEASLRYPQSPFFLGSLADVAWRLDLRDLAMQLMQVIVARWPDNIAVVAALSDLARASGDPAEMEAWLARVGTLPGVDLLVPSTLPLPLQAPVGRVQLDLGNTGRAVEVLSLRHAEPERFRGWRGDLALPADEVQWLVLALRRQGQSERAEAWLEAVAEAIAQRRARGVEGFTPLMLVEARNLAMQGRGDAALEVLEELLELGWHDVAALTEDPRWGALSGAPPFSRLVERAREMNAEDRERVLASHPRGELDSRLREALRLSDGDAVEAAGASTAEQSPAESGEAGSPGGGPG